LYWNRRLDGSVALTLRGFVFQAFAIILVVCLPSFLPSSKHLSSKLFAVILAFVFQAFLPSS